FNTRLLSQMAQATGGEISPKSLEKITKNSTAKSYQALRQPFIVLTFCLFLVEVAMRKFAFGEPD
ncbi:MAG: hypothetical protein ACREOR_02725, partial [Candidatus Binatia bacterium]